ncbi:DiGeorge syndrome critical region protein 14 [Balamuthia mandrillaris]
MEDDPERRETFVVSGDRAKRKQPEESSALAASSAASKALVEASSSATFKSPTLPARKKKPKVLEEETYVEALEDIIQRDFFPDLPKLRLQQELMEAQESHDLAKFQEVKLKLAQFSSMRREGTGAHTPFAAMSGFETPQHTSSAVSSSSSTPSSSALGGGGGESEGHEEVVGFDAEGKEVVVKTSLTLDKFLATYTSEDNASFSEIVDKMNERKKEKYHWLYKSEVKTEGGMLLLEGGSSSNARPALLTMRNYKAKNALMYQPEGAPLTAKEEEQLLLSEQKIIDHSNTRLPRQRKPKTTTPQQKPSSSSQDSQWQALPQEGDLLGLARMNRENIQSFDLDDLRASRRRMAPSDSPRVNGYGFVVTPSPAPGRDGGESPFMTWGSIEGTPLLLGELDDLPVDISSAREARGGPQFEVKEESPREKLAMKLAESASKEMLKRNKPSKASSLRSPMRTPSRHGAGTATTPQRTPLFAGASPSPRRTGTPLRMTSPSAMTPKLSAAGQELVKRAMKHKARTSDLQLRSSYGQSPLLSSSPRTPTPKVTPLTATSSSK